MKRVWPSYFPLKGEITLHNNSRFSVLHTYYIVHKLRRAAVKLILHKPCGEPSLLDQRAQYKFRAWRHPYDKIAHRRTLLDRLLAALGAHITEGKSFNLHAKYAENIRSLRTFIFCIVLTNVFTSFEFANLQIFFNCKG